MRWKMKRKTMVMTKSDKHTKENGWFPYSYIRDFKFKQYVESEECDTDDEMKLAFVEMFEEENNSENGEE